MRHRPYRTESGETKTMERTTLAVLAGIVTTVALVVGGRLSVAAHRAFRRLNSPPLRLLSYGVALIAVGVAVGGVLAFPFGVDASHAVLAQDTLVGLGLVVLLWAVYTGRSATDR